jgi:hypothetical protein
MGRVRQVGVASRIALVSVIGLTSAESGGVPWSVAFVLVAATALVVAARALLRRQAVRVTADDLLRRGVKVNPHSMLLAGRAAELTSARNRRLISRTLSTIAREVERPSLALAVPIDRRAVAPHVGLLRAVAGRVARLERPVEARGMLLASELVTDGYGSPLYAGGADCDVATVLGHCLVALDHCDEDEGNASAHRCRPESRGGEISYDNESLQELT